MFPVFQEPPDVSSLIQTLKHTRIRALPAILDPSAFVTLTTVVKEGAETVPKVFLPGSQVEVSGLEVETQTVTWSLVRNEKPLVFIEREFGKWI